MSTFAEQLEVGDRVRYPSPPATVIPAAYTVGTFVAPGVEGVVERARAVGPKGIDVALVRFEYRTVDGKNLLSAPIGVLPGQPCEVI